MTGLDPARLAEDLGIDRATLDLWTTELGLGPVASGLTAGDIDRLARLRSLVVDGRYTLTGALLRLTDDGPGRVASTSPLTGPSGPPPTGPDAAVPAIEALLSSARAEAAEARSALDAERRAHQAARARARALLADLRSPLADLLARTRR